LGCGFGDEWLATGPGATEGALVGRVELGRFVTSGLAEDDGAEETVAL
jgi:hypothetical protein